MTMTSDDVFSVFVPGTPAPKGSKRAFVRNGKAFMLEMAHDRIKSWEVALQEAAMPLMRERRPFTDTPLSLSVVFGKRRPKGHTGKNGPTKQATLAPLSPPDLSKLVRSTEDAWNGLVWDDDSRIVRIYASKVWVDVGEPTGAAIWVAPAVILSAETDYRLAVLRG